MKKCIIVKIFFIWTFACPGISLSQEPQEGVHYVNFLTPQTYDLIKYGSHPVSHFTGETNVTVPIYTYSDQDFSLPIYLGYNSSGFIPGKNEGMVGLNWYLNMGAGVVTRSVNGWPDEREGQPDSNPSELHGLFYGIQNGLFYSVNTKDKLWNQQNAQVYGTNTLSPIWHIYGCEADPDIFNFSMPGHSGTFFIENNGTTRNIGNKPYEVDLYNFALQPYSNWTINDSEIVIKTDDGFTYYFGGSKEYLEISYPVDEQDGLGSIGYPVIVGWHLNKIVAPNGRVATFEYVNNLYQPSDPQEQDFILSVYQEFSGHQTDVQGPDQTNGIYFNSASYGSSWSTQRQVTKPAYLKKISVGNTTIEFSYSEKLNKFYKDEYHAFNRKNYQLDSILVKSEGILVKEFNFGYEYLGGTTNARFFLTSFREVGMNPYKFEYYLPYQSLPDPKTRGIDHWGFWNSYDRYAQLIPELYFYRNGDTEFTQNDVRAASSSLYNATLLRKIIYPTLGFTEFIYEPHDYSERLERRSFNAFLPLLETVNGKAGGARIAFIKDHDGEEYTNEREFRYVHGFPTGGVQSSGILLNWPRYVFYYEMTNNGLVKHLEYKSTSYQVNHYPGEKYIQYADVTEISKPSSGCTQYKFSSYLSHNDFIDDDNNFPIIDYGNYVYNLDLFNNIKGLKYNDRSFERGKRTEVITYKSKAGGGFSPLNEIKTEYTSREDNPDNYIVGVHQSGGRSQSYKLYYYPVLPDKVTETNYSSQGTISATTENTYSYNSNNYLFTKNTTGSDVKTYTLKLKYPDDYSTSNYNYSLSKPVEIISYVDDKVTDARFIEYKDFTGSGTYPSNLWVLKTDQPLSSFQEAFVTKGVTWTNIKDSRYGTEPEATYDKYNNYGYLLQKAENGVSESYLWGYDQIYPIAKIENSFYDEYDNIVDAKDNTKLFTETQIMELQNYNGTVSGFLNRFETLRNALPNCMMTTYTYDPLFGITSQTDSNGITTYYEYDDFGRLSIVRDDEGNILKFYTYHYKE